jgi:hypothetical protein
MVATENVFELVVIVLFLTALVCYLPCEGTIKAPNFAYRGNYADLFERGLLTSINVQSITEKQKTDVREKV